MPATTLQLAPETAETALARAVFPPHERTDDCCPHVLNTYEPTTLADLSSVSLLNRVDTKYLIPASQLPSILSVLAPAYRVLDVDGCRVQPYQTTYFDTPDLALYYDHHAGRAARFKVRSRTYVTSGRSFFEIKQKTNTGRTVKHRAVSTRCLTDLTPTAHALLTEHLPKSIQVLRPVLHNRFQRITLVGIHNAERLTLDLGVQFQRADDSGQAAVLPGVVIAELKQSGVDRSSPFIRLMQRRHLRPTSVSKYCVGVAMLLPNVRRNAFKVKLRAIEKLARGEAHVR